MLQRVAIVAVALCLAAVASAADSTADSLAYKQEQPALSTAAVPDGMTPEDVFVSSFVEMQRDGMRKKSHAMATKFVEDLRVGLKKQYAGKGALSNAARSSAVGFDKSFREQCRSVSPSAKMCRNFVTIYRLQFQGQNPFAQANGNRKRFTDAVRNIILRWVAAWRQQHPKRSRKAGGNPWSAAIRRDGLKDVFHDTNLMTRVRGGLTRFGRLNMPASAGEKYLAVKPKGDYPLGSAMDDPHNRDAPYKAHRHVKHMREQLADDLSYLREKVFEKIPEKKFHRMIGNPDRAPKAILRTARICRREKKNHFFPPTFCRSVEYLAATNFVGRNFLRAKGDFSALLASFMDHNHKATTRYGTHVVRKPNYRQDVTAITAKFALKLRANKFNLRTFSREFVNMLSNVMAVPRHRIRVASVRFGGYNRAGRKHTKVTFEFLPKKGDRRIRSRPHAIGSVDSLAEQFRAMARNRPGSDFYKVPLLSRLLPRSLVMSKTLGRRHKSMARYNLQSANTAPRFAEGQTLAAEVAVSADEEVAEGQSEHEANAAVDEQAELESQDEEFTNADQAVDAVDSEAEQAADAEAEEEEEVAEAEGEELDAADAEETMTDAERAELAAAEAAGEVAFVEVGGAEVDEEAEDAEEEAAEEAASQLHGTDENADDVEEQTEALHLSADTETESEAEAEATESDAAADADEAEAQQDADEQAADAQEEAEDAMAEAEDAADEDEDEGESDAEEDESLDAEAEEATAAWHTAMMQQSEQLVMADESEVDADDSDESEDELDAEDEDEADSDAEDELEADAEGAGERSAAANSAAPTAAAESLPTLPEVNALPDSDAELKAAAAANDKASVANARVKAAVSAVDAEDAVFLETHVQVTKSAEAEADSSAAERAVPALAVAAALLLALAAQQ